MRSRAIVIITTLALLGGLALYLAPFGREAGVPVASPSQRAEKVADKQEPRRFSPPPSDLPVSADELHALLENPPAQAENLPKDELAARELVAKGVDEQPRDVQRVYYEAHLAAAPRALTELSRSLNDVRNKLGEDSEAYEQLEQQVVDYRARVDVMKQKLAALD